MNPHRHAIEKLYAHLHSSAQGLAQVEATQRLARYGINQIEKITEQSFAGRLLKEFTHFFALILWLAAGLAFVAEWKDPGQGMAMLGYAVLGVILINGLFSFWQEYRAEKALAALRNLLPHHTTALRDGKAVQLLVAELVPGDVVLLAAGDDVPADCRLIEAFGVRVNTANLTGESIGHRKYSSCDDESQRARFPHPNPPPQAGEGANESLREIHVDPMARDAAAVQEEQAALRRDILHAGTSLISGEAKAMVYATGGVRSIYSVFYPLIVIYAVIFLARKGGFIIASVAGIFYGLFANLEFNGVIYPLFADHIADYPLNAGYAFTRIITHILSFYLIAFLASFVVEQERKTRTLLAEKQGAFDQLDLLHRSIIESVDTGILTINLNGQMNKEA